MPGPKRGIDDINADDRYRDTTNFSDVLTQKFINFFISILGYKQMSWAGLLDYTEEYFKTQGLDEFGSQIKMLLEEIAKEDTIKIFNSQDENPEVKVTAIRNDLADKLENISEEYNVISSFIEDTIAHIDQSISLDRFSNDLELSNVQSKVEDEKKEQINPDQDEKDIDPTIDLKSEPIDEINNLDIKEEKFMDYLNDFKLELFKIIELPEYKGDTAQENIADLEMNLPLQ